MGRLQFHLAVRIQRRQSREVYPFLCRFWVVAGVAAGVAFLAKYSGAAVLPLLLLAADPHERRTPWPWLGLAAALAIAAPNLAWNATHDWISFRFQLHEGLVHADPPGALGLLRFVGDQIAAPTPLLALAGLVWAVGGPGRDRARRLGWWKGRPLPPSLEGGGRDWGNLAAAYPCGVFAPFE